MLKHLLPPPIPRKKRGKEKEGGKGMRKEREGEKELCKSPIGTTPCVRRLEIKCHSVPSFRYMVLVVVVVVVVVVVAFSSLTTILGECSTIDYPPALFCCCLFCFLYEVENSSHTVIPLFMWISPPWLSELRRLAPCNLYVIVPILLLSTPSINCP